MIDQAHALRIAQRLARHAKRPDALLSHGIVSRLWGLLETAPGARNAYGCPTDATLREHARTLTVDDLEAAAKQLAPPAASRGEGGTP